MAKQTRDALIASNNNESVLSTMVSGQNPDATTWSMNVASVKGTKTFSAAAPTTTPVQVLAANSSRIVAAIINNHATVAIYLGKDNTVTSSNGFPLAAGASFTDDSTTDAWWAVAASGTGDARILEVA